MSKCNNIYNDQQGVSLVLLAISIVVLFGFAALAIDVGHLYNVKNQLQVAADAAAMASAELLISTEGVAQPNARHEAQRVAGKNTADVAYDAVPGLAPYAAPVASGAPIPVALQSNDGNDAAGDIVVGSWTTDGGFVPGGQPINAIKVVARRYVGGPDYQPAPQNWFSRVFAIARHLGVEYNRDYSLASVAAVAIAAKDKLPLLPIAVNEYWDEHPAPLHGPSAGIYPDGSPYGQHYPQSFMRETNVDGSPGLAGVTGSNIFAILGADANKNNVANTMTSYMDVYDRNEHHTRNSDTWHSFAPATADGACGGDCSSNEFPLVPGGLGTGDVSQDKWDDIFGFLFTGLPDKVLPPNAVREFYRDPVAYDDDNYNTTNGNDPSQCPYATVAYFGSTGNIPGLPKGPNKISFMERWGRGDKFMVMVYDGTANKSVNPNQAGAVTIIGYGVIELDGYANNNFDGNPDTLKDGGGNFNGQPKITAYGHALKHKLAGEEDPYLIQPTAGNPAPDCSFTAKIAQVRESFAVSHLVDTSLHYGTHNQNQ